MLYIIITASIFNKVGIQNNKHRQDRYVECISSVVNMTKNNSQIKTIVVENNGQRSTFLDELGCDVVYTNNNYKMYCHKGINELEDIKHVIEKYQIEDNDTIIKLTGRYKLLNDSFLHTVLTTNFDAYVKFFNVCTLQYMHADCVLGLFAIKCKFLKEFEYSKTYNKSPEVEFATYIRGRITESKLCDIKKLDLECCFADNLHILIV